MSLESKPNEKSNRLIEKLIAETRAGTRSWTEATEDHPIEPRAVGVVWKSKLPNPSRGEGVAVLVYRYTSDVEDEYGAHCTVRHVAVDLAEGNVVWRAPAPPSREDLLDAIEYQQLDVDAVVDAYLGEE